MTNHWIRIVVPILCGYITSCCGTPPKKRPEELMSLARYWGNGVLAHDLVDLLERIKQGDMKAWDSFTAYQNSPYLDGEHGEIYSHACGELARRDPTFFLRRHLMGDRRAIDTAKRAYGWTAPEVRHTMERLNESRLRLSNERKERQKINEYIAALQEEKQRINEWFAKYH